MDQEYDSLYAYVSWLMQTALQELRPQLEDEPFNRAEDFGLRLEIFSDDPGLYYAELHVPPSLMIEAGFCESSDWDEPFIEEI